MLKEKNAPLERILSTIEKQTSYVFVYDPDELRVPLLTVDMEAGRRREGYRIW